MPRRARKSQNLPHPAKKIKMRIADRAKLVKFLVRFVGTLGLMITGYWMLGWDTKLFFGVILIVASMAIWEAGT